MAKRKRASAKKTTKNSVKEGTSDNEILDWRCIVHRQTKKNATPNEFPEFDDLGKQLGYTVELKGKKDAWEAMPQYRRWNCMCCLIRIMQITTDTCDSG